MDVSDIQAELRTWIATYGNQSAAAQKMGVTPSYFGEVLQGRRLPGPKILRALGLEKTFRRVKAKRK